MATATRAKVPCWRFSRIERLQDLVDRQRQAESYLLRSRCDARMAEERTVIDRRLATVQARLRRLQTAARSARRVARVPAT